MPALQVDDIQGIVLFGYGRLRSACYLLLRITEPAAAKAWLARSTFATRKFDPARRIEASTSPSRRQVFRGWGLRDALVDGDSRQSSCRA